MGKQATLTELTDFDRAELEWWLGCGSTQQRHVLRAQIILAPAAGEPSDRLATRLGLRRAQVCRWRTRFERHGLAGLDDEPRSAQPRTYDAGTDQRVLALLDQPPPAGCARWSGTLLAAAAGRRARRSGLAHLAPAQHQLAADRNLVPEHRSGLHHQSHGYSQRFGLEKHQIRFARFVGC